MERGGRNWFVRRGSQESGPFPAGLVSRYILLGRIREDDEVSWDRLQWSPVSRVPELMPAVLLEVFADPDDEEASARLAAARRWADERHSGALAPIGLAERRSGEADETRSRRRTRAARRRGCREEGLRPAHYAGFGLALVLLVALPFALPSGDPSQGPDCAAPAAPGVDWSGCALPLADLANADLSGALLKGADLSGAVLRASNLVRGTLSYANLTGANLRGANLRGAQLIGVNLREADLTRADLRGADLSYAVLHGARLEGARLDAARFDHAESREGIVCMPGSVGSCRPARVQGG